MPFCPCDADLPDFFFDFEDEAYLVVSLLAREDVLRAGVERLRACVDAAC